MTENNGNAISGDVIEGKVIPAEPTPARLRLSNIKDCRRELAKVYADARCGAIQSPDATRLTYILIALSNMIKDSDLEERIKKLEELRDGND